MKKAAVIGAVAYGSYQIGKLSAGVDNYGWGRQHGYTFDSWNRDREADGMLCRSGDDCKWIDDKYCILYFHWQSIDIKLAIWTICNMQLFLILECTARTMSYNLHPVQPGLVAMAKLLASAHAPTVITFMTRAGTLVVQWRGVGP